VFSDKKNNPPFTNGDLHIISQTSIAYRVSVRLQMHKIAGRCDDTKEEFPAKKKKKIFGFLSTSHR
jgi:hypothetical protein